MSTPILLIIVCIGMWIMLEPYVRWWFSRWYTVVGTIVGLFGLLSDGPMAGIMATIIVAWIGFTVHAFASFRNGG